MALIFVILALITI